MFRRVLLISTIMLALVASACSDGGGGGDDASTTSGVDLTELGPEGSLPPAPEGLEGLVIGSVVSETGSGAPYGVTQARGTELAVEQLGLPETALMTVDDESTDEGGVLAVDSIIAANAAVIIGPTLSPVAAVADPAAQEAGVPVLAATNTTLDVAAIGDHVWRISLSEQTMIPQAIAGAQATGELATAALISQPSDGYSAGAADAFRAGAAQHGVELVADLTYEEGGDLEALLTEATAADPDALFLAARSDFAADLLLAIEELELDQRLVGGNGFNAPEVFEAAGDAIDGLIVAASWNPEIDVEMSREFVEAYREAYDGDEPDAFAAQAYAAVQVAAAAARQAGGTTAADIQRGLTELGEIDTVLGRFSFTPEREPTYPAAIQVVEDGRFVLLSD